MVMMSDFPPKIQKTSVTVNYCNLIRKSRVGLSSLNAFKPFPENFFFFINLGTVPIIVYEIYKKKKNWPYNSAKNYCICSRFYSLFLWLIVVITFFEKWKDATSYYRIIVTWNKNQIFAISLDHHRLNYK